MDRATYNTCIARGMGGKHLTREQRNLEFCIVAKMCSGKSKSRDEALRICSQPKPSKPPRAHRQRRGKVVDPDQDAADLASCMGNIVSFPLPANRQQLQQNIFDSIKECRVRQQKQ